MARLAATANLMAHHHPERVVEVARHAEELGFTRCWVYDEGLATRDVYVVLTALALGTDRIRIGPGITNPYTRHPGTTAAAIASLDEVSGGRAFLGIGAGGGLTLGPLRVDRVRPAATVEEAVTAIRGLLSGETVDTGGFDAASLGYGRADLEIWVAGRGPRMHDVGGRLADGFHLSFAPKTTLGDSVERLEHASAGRRVLRSYSTMVVTDDASIPEARRQISFRVPDSPDSVREALGAGEADVAKLREALAAGGPAAAGELVPESWLEHFVIQGTHDACAAELARLAATHGLDEFQTPVLHLEDAEQHLETAADIVERANSLLER